MMGCRKTARRKGAPNRHQALNRRPSIMARKGNLNEGTDAVNGKHGGRVTEIRQRLEYMSDAFAPRFRRKGILERGRGPLLWLE